MSPQTVLRRPGTSTGVVQAVLEHESLPEAVRKALRRQILNDDLPAGERIVGSTVANDLGVSRATVREALPGLAAEGIIEITPRQVEKAIHAHHVTDRDKVPADATDADDGTHP
jgi:DNA-binding FadR family transcriptional regulator